jgi:hypothetical protein
MSTKPMTVPTAPRKIFLKLRERNAKGLLHARQRRPEQRYVREVGNVGGPMLGGELLCEAQQVGHLRREGGAQCRDGSDHNQQRREREQRRG